jgi:hypothetical protein
LSDAGEKNGSTIRQYMLQRKHRNFNNASREVGLEISIEECKYVLLSCHRNADKNRDVKIAKRSFENVSQFKYLEFRRKLRGD